MMIELQVAVLLNMALLVAMVVTGLMVDMNLDLDLSSVFVHLGVLFQRFR